MKEYYKVINRRYYWRALQIFLSYKRKKTHLSYLPMRLWVEPTSICNLRCVMCPNKELEKAEKGFMDMEIFKKVIAEASAFALEVHLMHRGESLLHPQFFTMVKYAHDAGITTKFHTNATLLDEESARKMIESGLDHLSFSFDGYDKTTYESIRVNGDFEKTLGNIIRFLEIKRELRSKKPFTVFEIINFPDIYKNVDAKIKKDFLRNFHGLPLDKIEVKEMHNWAGKIGGRGKSKKYSLCTSLWHSLIIFWDGSILPCTQDFHGYYILGNVRDSTLAQIWNSEPMVRLREKIIRHQIVDLETCSQCDRIWREQILGIPKEYLWKFLLNRMP